MQRVGIGDLGLGNLGGDGLCVTVRGVRSVVVVLAGVVALLLALSAPALAVSDTVSTQSGAVKGQVNPTFRSFKGIPYAAPPVGELRWRSPQPPAPWSGVRDALVPGSRCPQGTSRANRFPSLNEDCLYLNVTTPVTDATNLPVIVLSPRRDVADRRRQRLQPRGAGGEPERGRGDPSTTGWGPSVTWRCPASQRKTATTVRATTVSRISKPRCAGSRATSRASAATPATVDAGGPVRRRVQHLLASRLAAIEGPVPPGDRDERSVHVRYFGPRWEWTRRRARSVSQRAPHWAAKGPRRTSSPVCARSRPGSC